MKKGQEEKQTLIAKQEILDSDEQERVIHDLKMQAWRQSSQARMLFSSIFFGLAALFAVIFVFSHINPWMASHQHAFRDLLPHSLFQIFYILTGINCLLVGLFVRVFSSKKKNS